VTDRPTDCYLFRLAGIAVGVSCLVSVCLPACLDDTLFCRLAGRLFPSFPPCLSVCLLFLQSERTSEGVAGLLGRVAIANVR